MLYLPQLVQRVHGLWDRGILATDLGLPCKVSVAILILATTTSFGEEISAKVEESSFTRDVIQPQHGKLELWVARVPMQLVGAKGGDKAVYIANHHIEELTRTGVGIVSESTFEQVTGIVCSQP